LKKTDPRTKLALGFMAIFAILITKSPVMLIAESCVLFAALLLFGMAKAWSRSLPLVVPMVGLVFVLALLSFDYRVGLLLSLRLLNLLTASFVFFRTVGPEEIGDALRKMGIPYEFSFILTTSMRYVPLIGRRIRLIMDAQRSRGIDLRPRLKNVTNFLALLVPLLIQSFTFSDELAMAMESRGFALKGRALRKDYRMDLWEYGAMIFSLALLAALVWWERGG